MIQPNIINYMQGPFISSYPFKMPEPKAIQDRKEREVEKALVSLKPKAKFLIWMHEQLKKALKFIKELDKNYKP